MKRVVLSNLTRKNRLSTVSSESQRHSFAFAGSGWLMPFHLGVVSQLKDTGMINEKTIVAGTSGGALSALLAVSDVNIDDALQHLIDLSKDQHFKQNIHGRLRVFLKDLLPSNSVERCNKRLFVCVTKVWPNPSNLPDIICEYNSVDHLLDVVTASSFIPIYSNSKMLATTISSHNKNFYIDGGATAYMPPIGDIKVAPFSHQQIFWRLNPVPVDIHLNTQRFPLNKLIQCTFYNF